MILRTLRCVAFHYARTVLIVLRFTFLFCRTVIYLHRPFTLRYTLLIYVATILRTLFCCSRSSGVTPLYYTPFVSTFRTYYTPHTVPFSPTHPASFVVIDVSCCDLLFRYVAGCSVVTIFDFTLIYHSPFRLGVRSISLPHTFPLLISFDLHIRW